MNRKQLHIKSASVDGLKFTANITTETIDRDGEVVVPDGMDATDFLKSPTVFYNHDSAMPIGKCLKLSRGDGVIEAITQLAQRPDWYEGEFFPDFVRAMIEQDMVRGVSIGFEPLDGGMRSASKGDIAKYGEGVKRVFSKWKLLEYSVAPLPSNQDALVSSVAKGLISRECCKRAFGVDVPKQRTIVTVTGTKPEATQKKRHEIRITDSGVRGIDVRYRGVDIEKTVRIAVAKLRGQLYS